MKSKLFLTIVVTLFYIQGFSQTHKVAVQKDHSVDSANKENSGKIYTIVEMMPEFPGGQDKLMEYFAKNIKYPKGAKKKNITGVVYVTFIVNSNGGIDDAKILRGIGGGCDEEALRVVKEMPNWKPGMQNNKTVNVQYNVPIRFSLK